MPAPHVRISILAFLYYILNHINLSLDIKISLAKLK